MKGDWKYQHTWSSGPGWMHSTAVEGSSWGTTLADRVYKYKFSFIIIWISLSFNIFKRCEIKIVLIDKMGLNHRRHFWCYILIQLKLFYMICFIAFKRDYIWWALDQKQEVVMYGRCLWFWSSWPKCMD